MCKTTHHDIISLIQLKSAKEMKIWKWHSLVLGDTLRRHYKKSVSLQILTAAIRAATHSADSDALIVCARCWLSLNARFSSKPKVSASFIHRHSGRPWYARAAESKAAGITSCEEPKTWWVPHFACMQHYFSASSNCCCCGGLSEGCFVVRGRWARGTHRPSFSVRRADSYFVLGETCCLATDDYLQRPPPPLMM